ELPARTRRTASLLVNWPTSFFSALGERSAGGSIGGGAGGGGSTLSGIGTGAGWGGFASGGLTSGIGVTRGGVGLASGGLGGGSPGRVPESTVSLMGWVWTACRPGRAC